ncbi:MAG: glycosyltransferase, partial [Halothiobacillus sp.]|nr:glycosyltransferase [Halothiobacillus sp.]
GSLQEAGGIYWKDGSAWNFGRGANAGAPEFNYVKDVDYVSGAAIAIPTDIWQEMDGFDEIYAPAYCEDSDIAFRLREAGYRTLLNPASEVLHHEGRSHGRDLNSGIKAYQVKNQQTFLERWRPVLERDHYPNAQNVLRARDRSYYRKHVLIIDHYVPQWDQDAGSRSTFMCIKAMLGMGYAVTFWPDNLWRDPHYTPLLQDMGVEVIYGADYRDGFADFIRERGDLYDAVFANRPHIACHYMRHIRDNSQATILYYGHDLHYKRMMAAQAVGEPITNAEITDMRRQELEVCAQAHVVLYPDQVEVDMVAQELGGDRDYRALPVYAFEQETFDQSAATLTSIAGKTAHRLLFVGGFNHTPNQDGVLWLVNDILPIVQRKLGTVHLTIVGSKAPQAVLALESETIDVTGFVTDDRLAQLYDETSLVVAPLRYGGGVKGKVIEAMALGIPMVTTPTGAQGLRDPQELMFVANDAEDFADAVVRALTDRSEAESRARRAWDYARSHYSMQTLEDIFQDVIGR